MKNCQSCGHQNDDAYMFCEACGAKLTASSAVTSGGVSSGLKGRVGGRVYIPETPPPVRPPSRPPIYDLAPVRPPVPVRPGKSKWLWPAVSGAAALLLAVVVLVAVGGRDKPVPSYPQDSADSYTQKDTVSSVQRDPVVPSTKSGTPIAQISSERYDNYFRVFESGGETYYEPLETYILPMNDEVDSKDYWHPYYVYINEVGSAGPDVPTLTKGEDQLAVVNADYIYCTPILSEGFAFPYIVTANATTIYRVTDPNHTLTYEDSYPSVASGNSIEEIDGMSPDVFVDELLLETNTIWPADYGTKHTLGYFSGTNWVEKEIVANAWYFLVQDYLNSDYYISLPVEQTRNGYFVADYSALEPGHYMFFNTSAGQDRFIVSIVDGDSAGAAIGTGGYRTEAEDVAREEDALGIVELIDMPMKHKQFSGVDAFEFSTFESTDVEGYVYEASCHILCGDDGDYFGYGVNSKYSRLTGTLHAMTEGAVCWLEIYDGDELLFMTPEITDDNPSYYLDLDISDVDELIIYPCANARPDGIYIDNYFGWLITDDLVLRK